MDAAHTFYPLFLNPRNVFVALAVSGFALICLRVAFCFLLLVGRLHGKTPKMSPPVPLTCPKPCFRLFVSHTQSVGCVSFVFCVCIDGNLNLQHAQHGACSCLHSRSGRLALSRPIVGSDESVVSVDVLSLILCSDRNMI